MTSEAKRGVKGGLARAAKLSPERRREIALLASSKRWGSNPVDLQNLGYLPLKRLVNLKTQRIDKLRTKLAKLELERDQASAELILLAKPGPGGPACPIVGEPITIVG